MILFRMLNKQSKLRKSKSIFFKLFFNIRLPLEGKMNGIGKALALFKTKKNLTKKSGKQSHILLEYKI